ncbi:MAG: phenylalanine--tRNA ligase subunit beta [Bacteroidetes bacterium]|nr:MAG: phenylalanine--tRNA ligase subunit beta [Bacteroidota bacterium]
MKVSYRKIKEFLQTSVSANHAAAVLTATGLEIEGIDVIDDVPGGLRGLVVGEITQCEQHPNADRLKCCKVEIGAEAPLDIVCGAPNAATGLKVVVATVGAELFPAEGDPFKIKKGKIRGEVSMGMLCGAEEVGVGTPNGGIIELDSKWAAGTLVSEVFEVGSDEVLEIGLTPNRNDAMGHLGVARDLRAGLLHGTVSEFVEDGLKKVEVPSGENIDFGMGLGSNFEIKVGAKDLAPIYTSVRIDGVEIKPSPQYAQRFLKALGVSPINNIVDATNYVLHEMGQPLHAFDFEKIKGGELNVRLANNGETITTLDGEKRDLDVADLVIADASEAMCIAGVFGSEKHGVSNKTKSILIESAYFNPVSVRKSAKRHGLSTDASFRFERQIDPNLVKSAAERATKLILEWGGGTVVGADEQKGDVDWIKGHVVELEWAMLNRLIGQELEKARVKSILDSLDIEITSEDDTKLTLNIPAYRSDVTRPADVVEEILRIHGFDQIDIPSRITSTLEVPVGPDREDILFGLASTLVARGFNEIMSNSLTKAEYVEGVEDDDINASASVVILNPLSGDLSVMRQSLVFQGIEVIARNKSHRVADLKLFEFGRSYQKINDGNNGSTDSYKETEHLSLWVTGKKHPENWNEKAQDVGLFTIKDAVFSILDQIGIRSKISELSDEGGLLLEGNQIILGVKPIGRFGQVHPDITNMCGVDEPVFWADLLIKPLLKSRKKRKIVATGLPKFPSVRRDLSLILDKGGRFEEIKQAALKAERKLLKEVTLFDVYEGDKLEEGKVSYAVSLVLQDEGKTLNDKQIDKSVSRILEAITKETGAVLR